jgi:hypothetical protein
VFDVVLGISHQHLFDEIGRGRQEGAFWTDAEARKGTILTRRVEQKVKETGAELANVSADDRALRAGRQARLN